jgi:hypothetical protein
MWGFSTRLRQFAIAYSGLIVHDVMTVALGMDRM